MIMDIVKKTSTSRLRIIVKKWVVTTPSEIKELIGELFLIVVYKSHHQSVRDLFLHGRLIFRVAFGGTIMIYPIWFSKSATNKTTAGVKFAPIRVLFNEFTQNCRKHYFPGDFVCVDERLILFRGRCPFLQYLPAKLDKYGMNLFLCATVWTHYVLNCSILWTWCL